jgi:hypothetical protein
MELANGLTGGLRRMLTDILCEARVLFRQPIKVGAKLIHLLASAKAECKQHYDGDDH